MVSKLEVVKHTYNRPTASQAVERVLEDLLKEHPDVDVVKLAETAVENRAREAKVIGR